MNSNENLSDGAQQADLVSSENAETMFSADQAETNMVKLVDGKLTPIGDTHDDVSDDMPRIRLGSDEERALTGDDKKKYENSEAALRAGNGISPEAVPNDPIAVAALTGNPDAGSTVNTGLLSEDESSTDQAQTGRAATPTALFDVRDMIPPTPGSPDPTHPAPDIPATPPMPHPPGPGPEIPELPGQPRPAQPEIQEPSEPDRSHEVNAGQEALHHRVATTNFLSQTAALQGLTEETDSESGQATPGSQYEGMSAGPDDEGMEERPDTGDSAHPYDVNARDTDDYQPGERPEEGRETAQMPRQMLDESSVTAQEMMEGPDRSDQKSTDGLDRTYNDPQAARDMAS